MKRRLLPVAVLTAASALGAWRPLAPLPDPVGFGGMFAGVLQGRLIAGGGAQWDKPVWLGGQKVFNARLFALAAPDGAWTVLPERLPTPRGYFAIAAAPGAIYLAGGIDARGCLRTVQVLREAGEALAWSDLPELPEPVGYACAAIAGGRLFVVGGLRDPAATVATNTVWSLDLAAPDVAGWRREPDLPGPGVFVAAAASAPGAFHVFGGVGFDPAGKPVPSARAFRFDVAARQWRERAPLPEPRVGPVSPCAVLGDGRILVAGGYSTVFPGAQRDHPGFDVRTFLYDPAGDRWSEGPGLPKARVPDRDAPGDPGPAPMLGAPGAVWRGRFVAVSGEVRASVRSPQVLALPLDPLPPSTAP